MKGEIGEIFNVETKTRGNGYIDDQIISREYKLLQIIPKEIREQDLFLAENTQTKCKETFTRGELMYVEPPHIKKVKIESRPFNEEQEKFIYDELMNKKRIREIKDDYFERFPEDLRHPLAIEKEVAKVRKKYIELQKIKRKPHSKTIRKYDMDGNLIAEYDSVFECADRNIETYRGILHAIKVKKYVYRGFRYEKGENKVNKQ